MMMRTKEEITQTIKEQFVNVRERGRVLAQALKARADIAATRRRSCASGVATSSARDVF